MTKDQVSKLKKENDQLKSQVGDLAKQLQDLKQKIQTTSNGSLFATNTESTEDRRVDSSSIQFLSDEYDDLKAFKESTAKELKSITFKLKNIEEKLTLIDEAIESMFKYSYKYNIKIIGIQQVDKVESAEKSVEICLKLFKTLNAKVEASDIDIAHRVKSRNTNFPAPIICKFTRRIARESVMVNKKNLAEIDLEAADIPSSGKIGIFDHLTPGAQDLFNKAKSFQKDNKYAFCWTKNGEVLLKQCDDSRIIKVKDEKVLLRLPRHALTSQSGPTLPGHLQPHQFGQASPYFEDYTGPRTRSSQRS